MSNDVSVRVRPWVRHRGNVSRMRPQSDSFKQRVRGGFHDVADNPRQYYKTKTMERDIKFKKVLTKLSKKLPKVKYKNGDISDIGNEVGFQLGSILKDMTEEEIKYFIFGFRHGVSLTNGTH